MCLVCLFQDLSQLIHNAIGSKGDAGDSAHHPLHERFSPRAGLALDAERAGTALHKLNRITERCPAHPGNGGQKNQLKKRQVIAHILIIRIKSPDDVLRINNNILELGRSATC